MCVFYASRFRGYIERLVATHLNKTVTVAHEENDAFTKLSIDMATQSQALSVHTLTSLSNKSKHSFTSYPAAKHPKHKKNCHYRHVRKTSGLYFLLYNTGVDSSSRYNFANLGSFTKVSIPVGFVIPCLLTVKKRELCTLCN